MTTSPGEKKCRGRKKKETETHNKEIPRNASGGKRELREAEFRVLSAGFWRVGDTASSLVWGREACRKLFFGSGSFGGQRSQGAATEGVVTCGYLSLCFWRVKRKATVLVSFICFSLSTHYFCPASLFFTYIFFSFLLLVVPFLSVFLCYSTLELLQCLLIMYHVNSVSLHILILFLFYHIHSLFFI